MEISKIVWKLVLQESIDAIRAEVDKDMPLSGIQLLLAIPDKSTISFREIERTTQLPHSTASRGLALLAGFSRLRVSNIEPLVTFTDDAVDRRVRYASLSAHGAERMEKVYSIVSSRLSRLKQATKEV